MEKPMNTQGTNCDSVTVALPELRKRRKQVGAESVEGRLLSTLIEQTKNYQKETDSVARAELERFMGWTMDAIQRTA
jgi:hypothetical protein